ncbi:MAG: hypothetical protein DRG83_04835 [Deltaproteobacteria bacterium]|nr:MAG: hypothetical protein DRG83_04835 [Deltaproteobacteria bacterium]
MEDVAGSIPFTVGERIYIEYLGAIYYGWEWMYYPKTHPLYTDWEVVCPTDRFGYLLTIEDWLDNCNGVLSYCDMLELLNPDGGIWCHVDEVSVDIIVKKITEAPPPSWYKKAPYPDYAPSGMPDFDQKQDAWGPPSQPQIYTWCGPVAVANSLWWLDSEYESIYNPSPVPPPTISDNFPLVTSYNPQVWDDHDPRNIDPLVNNLAWLMDTDGQRTGDGHTGTRWQDMEWGINQYLIQQGVPDMFEVHSMEFPEFEWIEYEIERCQDVVLFLEFWQEVGPGEWVPLYDNPELEFGHFVTCAGVNSTTYELLISDPYWDAAEAGWPGDIPVPHPPHADPTVHNDTQYVSHDAYPVAFWIEPPPSPYPGMPARELVKYLQQLGYGPSWHAFIRAAVVTSPLGVHDIAVTNVTTSKDGCVPMPTVGQNFTATVNVTILNEGDFTENVTVTVYANTTAIGTQTYYNLAPSAQTTLTFLWDTTGFVKGNYTIWAYATPVPGETDTADNTFTDGVIYVGIIGDINMDKKVDMKDIGWICKAYGSTPTSPNWNPNADINNDNKIDMKDIGYACQNYGQTDP